jgi:hypothetical protein
MFHVDRRQEPRFLLAQPLRVTLLDPTHKELEASVIDVSAGGLCLHLPLRIPAGTPVKVETSDTLLLGDICYCTPTDDGFRAGLVVKHRMALQTESLHSLIMGG